MLRRVVYTTNAIESLNYQLRKITKNRGHFPSEEAAVKLLWLEICNIEDKRAAQRLTDAGKPPPTNEEPGRFEGWLQHVLRPEQQLKSLLGCVPV